MVAIPGGWLEMGSRSGQPDEQPVHKVWIDPFLMDRTEVTQEHYTKLMRADAANFKGPKRPVEMVSWSYAAEFCNKRSLAEGLRPCYDAKGRCDFEAGGYRLPTEAEWEYACRAGTTAPYCFGSDPRLLADHGWFAANSSKSTRPVGQKQPNPWGLFDMHGNVAEWCNDVYGEHYYASSPERNPTGPSDGEKYVLRGGAWNSTADACRSAYRVGDIPGFEDACFSRDAVGFRCVRRPLRGANGPTGVEGKTALATGFVYGDIYLQHKTGASHPERPERLTAIVERLKEKGLLAQLVAIKPAPAPTEWLTTVHTPEYVERIRKSCEEDAARFADSVDTPVGMNSYKVALEAVGGVLAAVDAVVEGKIRNAFCAIRPPGHHATKNRAMGFCIFNNVAIAARYIQKKHKLAKVLIVDWDVHHGNGTQAAFDDDPSVFYFSVHLHPFYPGTGTATDKGVGKAADTKLNVPLPAGSGDAEYRKAFEEQLVPAATAFKPDFVLISCGFDAHEGDPLGRMKLTSKGYAELTRIVKGIAEKCCKGRLVSMLEGGYNLDNLASAAEAHVRALME
jgi:acetoin utilization deacetylase AcuC-like enzyme/formylglycine-generating enzyme required for sulfatase activity